MQPLIPSLADLAKRILVIRREQFGDGEIGAQALADRLGIPLLSWENYESGVTMPGSLMVGFLVATDANPTWLMTGTGPRYLSKDRWDRDIPFSE
jgi:hypothetical protein